jgi:hypothetical protein
VVGAGRGAAEAGRGWGLDVGVEELATEKKSAKMCKEFTQNTISPNITLASP